MKQVLFFFLLQSLIQGTVNSQSFTIDDLLSLPNLTAKNIDPFMNKNGYSSHPGSVYNELLTTSYFEKIKKKNKDTLTKRSIDFYKKGNVKCFAFHTTSENEYTAGQKKIIQAGFYYDEKLDISKAPLVIFQKKNITIETLTRIEDGFPSYTFLLKQKEIPNPDSIRYAEDLLKFDSHEYLVSFFGAANVKKDYYYFSENNLKKCTVIFGNSSRQAVFIWDDENNYNHLSFIIISNIIHTVSAKNFDGIIGINEWELTNGIYPGMGLKELLKINGEDFEINGNNSELAMMAKPGGNGKIDFKKMAITLSCNNCNHEKIFNGPIVKAMGLAEENQPVYVYNIIIFPHHK
jgi:hypothetical protein